MSVQAIGERVRREEDWRLLTGRGRYVDDVPALGAARGHVVRVTAEVCAQPPDGEVRVAVCEILLYAREHVRLCHESMVD